MVGTGELFKMLLKKGELEAGWAAGVFVRHGMDRPGGAKTVQVNSPDGYRSKLWYISGQDLVGAFRVNSPYLKIYKAYNNIEQFSKHCFHPAVAILTSDMKDSRFLWWKYFWSCLIKVFPKLRESESASGSGADWQQLQLKVEEILRGRDVQCLPRKSHVIIIFKLIQYTMLWLWQDILLLDLCRIFMLKSHLHWRFPYKTWFS